MGIGLVPQVALVLFEQHLDEQVAVQPAQAQGVLRTQMIAMQREYQLSEAGLVNLLLAAVEDLGEALFGG